MKKCSKCGETKSEDRFNKRVKSHDGLAPCCKLCEAARGLAYRAANKEIIAARNASYYEANKDKVKAGVAHYHIANRDKRKEYNADYHSKNRDKNNARSAAYHVKNRERRKAYAAAYLAANPEAFRAQSHARRARKREAIGTLSKNLTKKLFNLQRGKCACCGLPLGDDYHLDHIMPLVLGGTNTDDNIQLLRARCNLQKRAKHPVEFMQQRGFLL